ncbi:TAXI family TRAP transporter solute-binding subunit [Enterovirga rhinocerotis]|uniref:TRAP-type uncharacterized transport system substrate-binding protein n=1 Tax=Enterovirga rhinocerotis TaxID=1339210 RepID=A0A4R7C127_9HYPH|nr:TAXI family TRAP transporter solute-binding subunit [Enterovirga rhinocerotis]TDR90197.1 TRAP-type uncharacterized transport system substrate-binding protein [Enterovirga rhinocerotis]
MAKPLHRRLPLWLRLTMATGLLLIGVAASFGVYRYLSRPVTLTIAVSEEGHTLQLLNALAGRMAETSKDLRLKVVPTSRMLEAASLFGAGKVDLAVLRADLENQGDARAVAIIAQSVVLLFLPHGSPVEDVDGLKGKTIGVVDGDVNGRIVGAIAESYGFDRARFRDLTREDARTALQTRQVQALLVVTPLTYRALATMRAQFGLKSKQRPELLAIDQAAAIAAGARYLESHELPKGTLSGSPSLPDEDLTTLQVPVNIVAQRKLDDATVAALTRFIIDAKGELSGKYPALALLRAPETEKDAYIPLHPGAAAYYEGDEKSFFDRYGDALFYGPMALGGLASLFAGLWRFLAIGAPAPDAHPVVRLVGLLPRIRAATDEAVLDAIEDEIDDIVAPELSDRTERQADEKGSDLELAVSRLEQAVARRRRTLAGGGDRTAEAGFAL